MKRFNCAANQIAKMGRLPSYKTLTNYNVCGLQTVVKTNRYWTLDKISATMHPISIMVNGRRRRGTMPGLDLESYMNFYGVIESFRQGFANIPGNRDCWAGFTESQDGYYYSLYFNLGRAFLKKLFNISLPYTLPPTYQKLFQELK